LKVFLRHEIRTGTVQAFGQRSKAAAAIEFVHCCYDGIALGLGACVHHGFLKQFIRNVYRQLHISTILLFGINAKPLNIGNLLSVKSTSGEHPMPDLA
jgi:hypothetical protein